MTTLAIKQKLHNYLEVADTKRLKAIYSLLENEIEEKSFAYPDELKNELDNRCNDYQKGKAKIVSAEESKKRIQKILNSKKKK